MKIKVKFERPFYFDNVDYKKGFHEVDASLLENWYFKAILKDGFVSVDESAILKEEIVADIQDVVPVLPVIEDADAVVAKPKHSKKVKEHK